MLHWLVFKANLEGCIWPPPNQCIISLPLWFETNHVPLFPCNKRQWKPYDHIMWWGVVKIKEFVDPKKPQNRVSTFEFWYLHGFPLSCRHDELSEPYLLLFLCCTMETCVNGLMGTVSWILDYGRLWVSALRGWKYSDVLMMVLLDVCFSADNDGFGCLLWCDDASNGSKFPNTKCCEPKKIKYKLIV